MVGGYGAKSKVPEKKGHTMSLIDVIKLRVRSTEQVTVTTAGTPVNPSSDTINNAVRITNNNAAKVVCVGLSTVDANSTPQIGTVLLENDSIIWYASSGGNKDIAAEVYIDADTNATVVTVEHLGA